ncbi:rod shape-determining protein MreC [Sphingomicrobium sediminis]|uniref:Cell shape-determining protein MreC n=1 Tax=Sphingomicrobium sediminis TaxID=2950949 RepID=A0A9X2EHB6_9SPHN|nr:rod shape-determining protein MreC [Sphingomicrobium sediminis]MCM8556681.1 rod shape-determining protein MreC [Sphingomicrobium sediminis]
MAASKFRRPGWSRRAQYSLFFSFVALAAGVALGIVLLAISIVAPRTFADLRSGATDLTRPIAEGGSAVFATVNGLVTGAGDYWNAASQNEDLREERDRLQRELIELQGTESENRRLRSALELRDEIDDPVASGRIIGSSQDSPRRYAILNAGRSSGVLPGMPVRGREGLIGRTVDAGIVSSRILLLTDREVVVPAQILRSDIPVIARGRGDGTVDLRPLEVGRNPFEPGDVIVTSGTGGLYPPLVPVARVVRLDDDGAIALPLENPSQANFAIVEQPFAAEALDDPDTPLEGDPEGGELTP